MSKYRRGTDSKVRSKRTVKPRVRSASPRKGNTSPPAVDKTQGKTEPALVSVAQPTVKPGTVAILAIGDEVLRGEVANTNAVFLSDLLFDAGYEVRSQRVVSDTPADIHAALEDLASKVSVIIATGGLGPTDDDRTVDVVCELLGVGTVDHAASLEAMKQRFSAHGFLLTPNNLRQVRVPAGAQVFPNSAGIAPGFSVKLGAAEAYFLPGIPREMEGIFTAQCMPRLMDDLSQHGVPRAAVRTFHIYGMGESHIDHRLVGLIENIPNVTVHFRTAAPENHVKIVVRTRELEKSQALLEQIDHELRKRIGQGIYGIDGETFPMVVGKTLREAKATLALAESCTAGYAGQLITTEPGSSEYFLGGVMAYANEIKTNILSVPADLLTEHGAVSEPCARAMAEGVRKVTGATIGVAITGVAGSKMDGRPSDPVVHTAGDKPAGSVCFAVAGPRPTKSTSKLFLGDRERIRKAAAYYALDMARRYFL
jgi:nicotinamide-nucleotide amidase